MKVAYCIFMLINFSINNPVLSVTYICRSKAAFPGCIIYYAHLNPCLNRLWKEQALSRLYA